jgi:hypothetical protein
MSAEDDRAQGQGGNVMHLSTFLDGASRKRSIASGARAAGIAVLALAAVALPLAACSGSADEPKKGDETTAGQTKEEAPRAPIAAGYRPVCTQSGGSDEEEEAGGAAAVGGYAGRFGGKKNLRARGGGGGTEASVITGLRWLARHQDGNGRWSTTAFDANCEGELKCTGPGWQGHDVGLTGLSVLAFLGAGYTPESRYVFDDPLKEGRRIRFADTVRRGLEWLKGSQGADGCFGEQKGEFMYDHAMASMAVAEAAWLTGAKEYRDAAQKGIDFLCKAQNPGLAWRYTVRPGDNDTSVTGWAVMALRSAELAGLEFDKTTVYGGAGAWLRRVTNQRGEVGYESPGDKGSVIPGINDKWEAHPSMTAIGLLAKLIMEKGKTDPILARHAQVLAKDLPVYDVGNKTIDFYYWQYGALALFTWDAPSGPAWKVFNDMMKKSLVPSQVGYGKPPAVTEKLCADGSWDPGPDKWTPIGGRACATALNVLTLEVYYRYPVPSAGGSDAKAAK